MSKAWGLVTVTFPGAKRSVTPHELAKHIAILYDYASKNLDKEFLVAYSGSEPDKVNLNGYSNRELAAIFRTVDAPENIVFEERFYDLINEKTSTKLF